MNVLGELKQKFRPVLASYGGDENRWLAMIRPAQDSRHGDYQINCAMPLGKSLNRQPREVAGEITQRVDLAGTCSQVEVAGPGFINLRLDDGWLSAQLQAALADDRLGVPQSAEPGTYVVDFSSPNVAKPMHVGHIRSTVLGDALTRILRFLGHRVISDNHLGDWGTQFGMILYGYKHFLDRAAYEEDPLSELARLYRLVRQIVDYQQATMNLPTAESELAAIARQIDTLRTTISKSEPAQAKQHKRQLQRLQSKHEAARLQVNQMVQQITAIEADPDLGELATRFPFAEKAVLRETARLHAGDRENRRLWNEFLPYCKQDIQAIYQRLGVSFDVQLGESFYQDQLDDVVASLRTRGLARTSDGAVCVFLDGFDAPMIVQKKDGAFLYSTSDLATIKYRMSTWNPDVILYVVDHRQHEHFAKLFATARLWGYDQVQLYHVSFGTVMGADGKPFKTRAGDTVGLHSLLNEAEHRALAVVQQLDDQRREGPQLDPEQRRAVARAVGIGALKYADLSQNRQTDYEFSYDRMLALNGNTATYLQYSYARVQGIFKKGGVDVAELRERPRPFLLEQPVERTLALSLVRLAETLDEVIVDYRPNVLANYLFELTQTFFTFYEQCPVLEADSPKRRASRLQMCDLTARTIRLGLDLLGIQVVDTM